MGESRNQFLGEKMIYDSMTQDPTRGFMEFCNRGNIDVPREGKVEVSRHTHWEEGPRWLAKAQVPNSVLAGPNYQDPKQELHIYPTPSALTAVPQRV